MSTDPGTGDAERRVWAALPGGTRAALAGLPASDLHTLLLSVARDRAARVRPVEVLRRWRQDRFVRPAGHDPRTLAAIEQTLWRLLPAVFTGVELSPVAPLGTCSALGPVSQNRIVSTIRSVEVVSDSTNALAVEAADRRARNPAPGGTHLAASHRQLRAQRFGPGMAAHFRLFALVSSDRDAGSGATEARLLALHLGYWRAVLAALLPATAVPQLRLTVWDSPTVGERIADTLLPVLADTGGPAGAVPVRPEPDRVRGRGYYLGAALRITAERDGYEVELGDGGLTDWTARLLGNAKERCLVSCLAIDRLADLTVGPAGG